MLEVEIRKTTELASHNRTLYAKRIANLAFYGILYVMM